MRTDSFMRLVVDIHKSIERHGLIRCSHMNCLLSRTSKVLFNLGCSVKLLRNRALVGATISSNHDQFVPAQDRTFPMLSVLTSLRGKIKRNKSESMTGHLFIVAGNTVNQTPHAKNKPYSNHRRRSTKWRVDSFWML